TALPHRIAQSPAKIQRNRTQWVFFLRRIEHEQTEITEKHSLLPLFAACAAFNGAKFILTTLSTPIASGGLRRIINCLLKTCCCAVGIMICGGMFVPAADQPRRNAPTMAEVLAASKLGDWRMLDPE